MNHWMFVALVVFHIFVCVFLVLLILIQNDKGGGLAGAFGGMGGGAAFTGSSTATFLTTITGWTAVVSFALLLGLNYMSTRGIESGRKESELKGARHGLSAVLPSGLMPTSGNVAPAIPGLGNGPATPGTAAPAGIPGVGGAAAPSGSKGP